MRRRNAHIGLAAQTALAAGIVLGARESLVSVAGNAAIQPGDYLGLYFAVPILSWVALAAVVVLPVALVLALRPVRSETALAAYTAALAFAGAFSISSAWIGIAATRLAAVGATAGAAVYALLFATALLLAVATAAVLAAIAQVFATPIRWTLSRGTVPAVLLCVALLWPIARFFAGDWKWGWGRAEARSTATAAPNLLLITIDTLRADHLGAYGDTHGLTPALDALAARGVVFENAISPSPWTLPALASLMTGLYPHHHGAGAVSNGRTPLGRAGLRADATTLADVLHRHGYRTHAIVSNPYLGLHYGLDAGFETYENVTIQSEAFLSFVDTAGVRLIRWMWPAFVATDAGATVSEHARQWLAQCAPEQPFFLWLHYIDPHAPYTKPGGGQHKSLRGDLAFAPAPAAPITDASPDIARLRSGEIRLNAAEREQMHDLYRDEVREVDRAVGDVLAAVRARGLDGRTIIAVAADHGEEFWEHGGVEHGHTVYDELVHVPLILAWEAHVPAAARVAPLVRLIDVSPSLLELMGTAAPPQDGASFMPLVRGGTEMPRIALSENLLFADERVGIRDARWKYVRWQSGKEEVYDLASDPGERRDLAGVDTALAAAHALYRQAGAPVAPAAPAQPAVVDAATNEAMRALGYVE